MSNVANVEMKKAVIYSNEFVNVLPEKKQVSELSQLTQSINKTVEGSVRGLSSYFKEFRKSGADLNAKMKLYNAKGRTFNTDLCHKIINLGEISHITKGSDMFEDDRKSRLLSEGKEYKPFSGVWSANRLQSVFFFVVETTPKK